MCAWEKVRQLTIRSQHVRVLVPINLSHARRGLPSYSQARAWSRATLAVGPHGAGLSNLIFMPRNGALVELRAIGRKGQVRLLT